jgi:3-hydroxyisobutyrate dehydrogenase-like beta-hydroxyacid dehydrogenase
MKLISNRLLTSVLVALAESIGEIEAADLPMEMALEALQAGAVPRLLDYKAGPMADRDFTPRFTIDLMAKDLGLAAELFTPGALAAVSESILLEAQAAGYGPADIGAVTNVITSPGLRTIG